MTLLPGYYETFVLVRHPDEVISIISKVTTGKLLLQNLESDQFLFSGWVQKEKFRISLKIKRPNSYIPLAIGNADKTSSGCLLFVTYQLFPSTRMFLIFWSLLIFLIGLVTAHQYQSVIYLLAALLILAFIHWVVWSNFKIQLKLTREALLKILTSPMQL